MGLYRTEKRDSFNCNIEMIFTDALCKVDQISKEIHKVSNISTPVLVRGAFGTEKKEVARTIHYNSLHQRGSLFSVHCSNSLPQHFEVEPFEYGEDSLRGCIFSNWNLFQMLDKGTLLLNEIGNLSLDSQWELVRLLEIKTFGPIEVKTKKVKCHLRLIATSSDDLEAMVAQKTFLKELLSLLNTTILVPHQTVLWDKIEG